MLSLVDEKFTGIKNAKDVQNFLRDVDVSDRRVGQTYVDSTIENDVPEAMVEMLNNGWRNSIKPDCQVSALKYVLDRTTKICMEHIAKNERDGKTATLIRPLDSKSTGKNKSEASTLVSSTSWWHQDPTGEMTIKQLQKTRNSKKLFKKGNLTNLGAQLLRLQKL